MFLQRATATIMQRVKAFLFREIYATLNQHSYLQRQIASRQVRALERISSFADVEFRVSSQWGEDGILDWLIERARIPPRSQSFIEFGVENYRQSNTRFLLQNRNWRRLIMDGSPKMPTTVKDDGLLWAHDLLARSAFITRENINDLIASAGLHGEIGLLSIDLDGNDYWLWEAIKVVSPILLVCEYNSVFGDVYPITTPYDPAFQRTKAHFSNLYFGASIGAVRSLASKKGYHFLGTTTAGNDAFFVRHDYAQHFTNRTLEKTNALVSRARESRDPFGHLDYMHGIERPGVIAEMPVINVETGQSLKLGDLGCIYSADWLAALGDNPRSTVE